MLGSDAFRRTRPNVENLLVPTTGADRLSVLALETSPPLRFAHHKLDVPTYPADFNGVGGATVQDLFDFLTAYFPQHLRADVNRGGALTVQDIFTSPANDFTGC